MHPRQHEIRRTLAAMAAAVAFASCQSAGRGPAVPRSPDASRAAPDRLPVSSAFLLDVDNRPGLFPNHVAVHAFADGFQRSEFLPSRPAPEIDVLRATEVLQRVLNAWPVPLRGHSYTIQAVEADAPVLQAYGAGRLDATSALLAGLGLLESELAALLALAVARTELDHPARFLQSAPRAFHEGIARAGARGVPEEGVRPALSASNLIARLPSFGFAAPMATEITEADAMASFYLDAAGAGPGALAGALGKLTAFDRRTAGSFRETPAYAAGLVDPARIRRILRTTSIVLRNSAARLGLGRRGEVRAGFQPLWIARYGPLVNIIGVFTLAPTEDPARLGNLNLRIAGRRAIFSERSAEVLYPGTSVAVVYSGRLPEQVSLDLIAAADYGPVLDGIAEWRLSDAILFDRRGGSTAAAPRAHGSLSAP